MSKLLQSLRAEARELTGLRRDLAEAPTNGAGWDATMPAPRTLGAETTIEKWFLAQDFLNTWSEWEAVLQRYPRCFGQTRKSLPATWEKLKSQCCDLSRRLEADPELDARMAASWQTVPDVVPAADADVRVLFQQVVAAHARLSMLGAHRVNCAAGAWAKAIAAARRYDDGVKQQLALLPESFREPLAWHLRHYRHAMLDVSWLDEPRWSEADESRRTAFEHVLGRPLPPPPWVEEFLQTLPDGGPPAECIRRVLSRMTRAVAEIGYESFFNDVTSAEMRGGADSPLGDDAVRLIRKDTPATDLAAARIVVGVARGSAKRAYYGRPNVLRKLGETLLGTTAPVVAIMLADSWDTADFQREHFSAFRLHHKTGHRFLFLLVGSETNLSPIDLGTGATTAAINVDDRSTHFDGMPLRHITLD